LSPDSLVDDDDEVESDTEEEFRNFLKNYDATFDDEGCLGIFRLDPPRRNDDPEEPNKRVTRVPHWLLSAATGVVFSWITSSRVLVSDRPIPLERFDEFDDMVRIAGAPPKVRNIVGERASVSYLRDLDHEPSMYEIPLLFSKSDPNDLSATGEEPDFEGISEHERNTGSSVSIERLTIETEMELLLQKMASLLSVTFRRHGAEAQRLATLADSVEEPFPGARTLLKGGNPVEDYSGLNAANVIDTLTTGPMNNSIQQLAEAGFDTVRPDYESSSNHEYERLFREARDAITGKLVENADRDELVDIVAGMVMKSSARAERNPDFAEEDVKLEDALNFAGLFVNDVFYGLCDGDFYEFRRHENSLAAGYNAAIRRRQHESFAEAADTDSTDEKPNNDTIQDQ
jgi:CRISPR type I-D-associated protein Csc3/Cas10d